MSGMRLTPDDANVVEAAAINMALLVAMAPVSEDARRMTVEACKELRAIAAKIRKAPP